MVYSNVFCFLFYTEAYPASSSHIINSQFLTRSPVNRTRTLIKSQALLCAIQLHHQLNVLAHSRRQFTSVSSMDTFISCVYVLILCACLTAGGIRIRQEWEWQGFFFFYYRVIYPSLIEIVTSPVFITQELVKRVFAKIIFPSSICENK